MSKMMRLAVILSLAFMGAPAAAQVYGVTPATTAASTNSIVAKSAPGTRLSAYATNATATAGFLIGYNAVSVPADGALTGSLVLDCVPLPASGMAQISNLPGPGVNFSAGVVYFLSSASSCFTKTTGTITGFISVLAQ